MISVIIPTYNRGGIFFQCLNSVIDSIADEDEIIVVNDYKNKEISLEQTNTKGKRIVVLNNPKQGVASARNYGAEHAKGELLLFVDDDMIVNNKAIESGAAYINKNINVIVIADWVYTPNDIEKLKESSFGRYLIYIGFHHLEGWNKGKRWERNTYLESTGITSQFMMLRKDVFEKIGGYNESFPFAGFEDAAFGHVISELQIPCVVDTHSLIYHNEIDRMQVLPFLERKKRGAFTRAIGKELGYDDFQISYSFYSKLYYRFLVLFKPVLLKIVRIIPNKIYFDLFYRFVLNRLVGVYIYEGYHKLKINSTY